jgi:hypothetical protein
MIESEHCDLSVTPGLSRRWLGVSGHNIPSFEVFLSPDWRGTEGVYYADQPSYRSGNRVAGVRLEFQAGIVTRATAEEGQEFVRKQLAMDEGASRLGEFSLTDRRHSRINAFMASTLFDENYGGEHGNCHVAVGASYSDTLLGDQAELDEAKKRELGFNDSALHWDLVNTEDKTVTRGSPEAAAPSSTRAENSRCRRPSPGCRKASGRCTRGPPARPCARQARQRRPNAAGRAHFPFRHAAGCGGVCPGQQSRPCGPKRAAPRKAASGLPLVFLVHSYDADYAWSRGIGEGAARPCAAMRSCARSIWM